MKVAQQSANVKRVQSISADAWLSHAYPLVENGYGAIVVGRNNDPKMPWLPGLHGWEGINATPDQFESLLSKAQYINSCGTPGILGLAGRLPMGVLGIDVDAYGGKQGLETLKKWEKTWGPLPPTYTLTARDDGSGIRLYRVREWLYPKEIQNTGVEFIDHHHRYVLVPPSYHHTGKRYVLYDPDERIVNSGTPPPRDQLVDLPTSYAEGLVLLESQGGRVIWASSAEVEAFSSRYVSGPCPEEVEYIISRTIFRENAEGTRNPTRDALLWAARYAMGGCFAWDFALHEITCAAKESYEKRGFCFDERMIEGLISEFVIPEMRNETEDDCRQRWRNQRLKRAWGIVRTREGKTK